MITYFGVYILLALVFSRKCNKCYQKNIIPAFTQLNEKPLIRKLRMEMMQHAPSGQHYSDDADTSPSDESLTESSESDSDDGSYDED